MHYNIKQKRKSNEQLQEKPTRYLLWTHNSVRDFCFQGRLMGELRVGRSERAISRLAIVTDRATTTLMVSPEKFFSCRKDKGCLSAVRAAGDSQRRADFMLFGFCSCICLYR